MKNNSLLAVLLLVFVVLGCDEPNSSNNQGPGPSPPSGQSPGRDEGPISNTSGPGRTDFAPRDPTENADFYRQQQQGIISPCAQAYDYYHAAYLQNRNNQMPIERFREYENAYRECVRINYRQ